MSATDDYFTALQTGDAAKLDALVREHPDLVAARTAQGNSGVLVAIYYGHPELAERLIARGLTLDVFEAAAAGRLERVVELVDADPALANAYAADGFTPLGLAAFFGHLAVAEALLARGAEPGRASRNAMRVQPLHSAVAHRRPEVALSMARQLLEHGADPNAAQEGGWRPLHEAAVNGHHELAALLLRHGADPRQANADGVRPAALAQQKGHTALAELLEQHSAL